MQPRPFANTRLRDVPLFVLIGIYYVGVLLASVNFWPTDIPTVLLAIPIIAVSLIKPPQFVIATALLASLIYGIDILVEHPPVTTWGVSFLALVGIGFLATLISLQRQHAAEKSRQQEARIRAVEQLRQPLTVVVGYTQFLRARPDLPTGLVPPLDRIYTAAKHLQQQIDRLLDDGPGLPA